MGLLLLFPSAPSQATAPTSESEPLQHIKFYAPSPTLHAAIPGGRFCFRSSFWETCTLISNATRGGGWDCKTRLIKICVSIHNLVGGTWFWTRLPGWLRRSERLLVYIGKELRNRSIVTSLKLKKGVGGALDDGVQKLGETQYVVFLQLASLGKMLMLTHLSSQPWWVV